MCLILCVLSYTFLKCHPKKGSIGFHRLLKAPMARKRLQTLGRPSDARRYKVNPGWHAWGRYTTELLLLPILEDSLQHYNPFHFELTSEEKNSRNQCQAPAGGAAASLGAAFRRPDTLPAQTTSFHTSNHQHPAPPHCTPCPILGNHGNHSTDQGQAELWATLGDHNSVLSNPTVSLLCSLEVPR